MGSAGNTDNAIGGAAPGDSPPAALGELSASGSSANGDASLPDGRPREADHRQSDRPGRCVIVGAGGHGRVVLDILMNSRSTEIIGFVDSNPDLVGRRIDGIPVLGALEDLGRIREAFGADSAIVAIGNNGVRRNFADRIQAMGFDLASAIHPSAHVARNASLGRNLVVAAGALVGAHCQIGDSVILNTGCIVDHESLIGTATHVCPGARLAGRVTVESGAFVGIGATVIQNIRIGYEAVIGAGAVVITDVAPMSTVVGVPARPIKYAQSTADAKSWLIPEFADAASPETILAGKLR